MRFKLKNWILAFGLVFITGLFWVKSQGQARLVVVDMKRLMSAPSLLLSRSHLKPEEQAEILKKYSSLLPEVLSAYAKSEQVTIIATPVLASGNNLDISDVLVALTLKKVKAHD